EIVAGRCRKPLPVNSRKLPCPDADSRRQSCHRIRSMPTSQDRPKWACPGRTIGCAQEEECKAGQPGPKPYTTVFEVVLAFAAGTVMTAGAAGMVRLARMTASTLIVLIVILRSTGNGKIPRQWCGMRGR